MERIEVKTPLGAYPIFIGENLVSSFGDLVSEHLGDFTGVVVVTNPTVAKLWSKPVISSLEKNGFSPTLVEVPDGEQFKTLATVSKLYEAFLKSDLDTRGLVIALGGGVVGDMAGFAAASYMRGVEFVQIPTTLLSMVDSSVGGKTGVDLPGGKNLVGAYKQPGAVLVDPTFLSTLPKKEISVGLAEVLKHGIIGNKDLFEELEGGPPDDFTKLVADAVRVKVSVVERDPFEKGERAKLNLGHTFGHALELLSNFKMSHGEAVGLGLVAATKMACSMNMCNPDLLSRIERAVANNGLPTTISGYDIDKVIGAMRHDKKRVGKSLRFVVPTGVGAVEIVNNVPEQPLVTALSAILGD